jgi:hypothetical protein
MSIKLTISQEKSGYVAAFSRLEPPKHFGDAGGFSA